MGSIAAAPLRLLLETVLACPADEAWRRECRVGHLHEISGPLIIFRSGRGPLPDCCWHQGQVLELRGYLLGILPLGCHRVEVVEFDPDNRKIVTEEGGGPIRLWRHRVKISPVAPDRCRYSDDLLIDAGALTRPLRLLACLTYRLRQRRWRSLARRLAGPSARR